MTSKKSKSKQKKRGGGKQDHHHHHHHHFDPNPRPILSWVDVSQPSRRVPSSCSTLRVVSWNVLARTYCHRRSHPHLPKLYQHVVFSPPTRFDLLVQCCRELLLSSSSLSSSHDIDHDTHQESDNHHHDGVDILCLQEVDMVDELCKAVFTPLGYTDVASTPTSKGGVGGRVDAVCVIVKSNVWNVVQSQVIRLDDIATLGLSHCLSLQGLQQSFLRHNVALLVRLRHVATQHTIVVVNAHLYWNPLYEYVKLCQIHFVLCKTREFVNRNTVDGNNSMEPVILCGDLNSKPSTLVHEYLVNPDKGGVNAKLVAPWYRCGGVLRERDNVLQNGNHANQEENDLATCFAESLHLQESAMPTQCPNVRYMLDYTLNRFTRWLRILGIDAALETEQEEMERTKMGNMILFERCRGECRTLITTSSKLVVRKDCPPGTYLISPTKRTTTSGSHDNNNNNHHHLESALVNLMLAHGVVLRPAQFLSRCVVCNGTIVPVQNDKHKRLVFAANKVPDLSDKVDVVYECNGCLQGYWWSDNPMSSASRVKNQATRLFELCLRAGVPMVGEMGMFDFVDVPAEREKGLSEEDNIQLERLDVVDWLKDEHLSHSFSWKSAYALHDAGGTVVGEDLPFTNVTHDFVGLLDYIFFDTSRIRQTKRLYVPTSFKELNPRGLHNGHLLPSNRWPSDHLAIGAELQIVADNNNHNAALSEEDQSDSTSTHDVGETVDLFCQVVNAPSATPAHTPRCACGCVPQILSLFEMAELRRQARQAAPIATNETVNL